MNNKLKIKINGTNIQSLFFALFLVKIEEIDIHLSLTSKSSLFKEKFYILNHSTKLILEKLRLWEKLEPKLYGINSISFYNNNLKEEISFQSEDIYSLSKNDVNILWTLNQADLVEILLKELSNKKNLYFLKNNDPKSIKKDSYYDFCLYDSYSNLKKYYQNKILKPLFSGSYIIFKVIVRENIERKFYQNFLSKESLLMLPLEKNIYQIIWKTNTLNSKKQFNLNENLILDNLSTILPDGFKLDQIIGDINILSNSVSHSNSFRFYRNILFYNKLKCFTNNIFINELNTFLLDLKNLIEVLSSHKTINSNLLRNLKYRFHIKSFIMNFSKQYIKKTSIKILIRFDFIPKLLIRSYFVFFKRNHFIKKLFKDIFLKSIFTSLIK